MLSYKAKYECAKSPQTPDLYQGYNKYQFKDCFAVTYLNKRSVAKRGTAIVTV